jgi:hypothetical protein
LTSSADRQNWGREAENRVPQLIETRDVVWDY